MKGEGSKVQGSLAGSGKRWTLREVRRLLARSRWWLLGPFFFFGLAGFVVQWVWPPRYRSQALILVREQVVAPKLVAPNVQITAADRLQAMTQQILSRSRLQNLIEQDGLYPGARQRLDMDGLVKRMRKDIDIEPVVSADRPGELTAFRISYLAPTARLAQRVVNELTSLFIQDNLQARAAESAGATDFLQAQLDQARQNLQQQQAALAVFKRRYLGELPEQEQANLEILNSLRAQYSAGAAELDRAEQQETYWQSLVAAYAHGGTPAAEAANSPQAHIRALRAQLAALESDHTDLYPDVIAARRELKRWQAIAAAAPQGAAHGSTSGDGPAQLEAASRLRAERIGVQRRRAAQAALAERIHAVQAELAGTPLRAQQIAVLQGEVTNAQQAYDNLLAKVAQSRLATDLEQSQQGERFQVIDAANLPVRPAQPNRALILAAGWLLGILAGAGALALRQMSDQTLHGESALSLATNAPVLALIGTMTSPRRRRLAAMRRAAEAAAVVLLVVLAAGSVAFTAFFMS